MLCMGGRSLAGGCCAGRKASSAGCCGVVLVLVAPGLDPAYSPAVVAQEALSTRCSQAFLPLPDPVCTPDEQNSDLPGCVAVSDSYDECVRLMREAIPLHIHSLRRHGDPIPLPSTVGFLTINAA
jgi:hypothetical protein